MRAELSLVPHASISPDRRYEENFVIRMRQERLDVVMANPQLAPMLARTPTVADALQQYVQDKAVAPRRLSDLTARLGSGVDLVVHMSRDEPTLWAVRKASFYGSLLAAAAGAGIVSGVLAAVYVGCMGTGFAIGCSNYENHAQGALDLLRENAAEELSALRQGVEMLAQPLTEHLLRELENNEELFCSSNLHAPYEHTMEELKGRLREIEANDRLAARVAAQIAGA